MAVNPKNYDGDLHMIVLPPKPINLNYLAFLRYLGEQGTLDDDGGISGPVSGPLVTQAVEEIARRSPDYSGKAA